MPALSLEQENHRLARRIAHLGTTRTLPFTGLPIGLFPAGQALATIFEAVQAFEGDPPPTDDKAALILRRCV